MTIYSIPGMNPDGSSSERRRARARRDVRWLAIVDTWQLRPEGLELVSKEWRTERRVDGELVEVEVGRKDRP